MSRLELLVKQVNGNSYRKEWKDKLEEKLSGAGYNCDNDRPGTESFIHFGTDILFEYQEYCNGAKNDEIPSEDEVTNITEIILVLLAEWQIVEFLDGKLYYEQEKEIRRLLKDSMRRRIIESASQDSN